MSKFTALIDTNCLFPHYLRDILLDFSIEGMYEFRWTEQIKSELIDNLVKIKSLDLGKAEKLISTIDEVFPDAIIPDSTIYLDRFSIADKDDEKILSSALASNVGAIVTENTKDFPKLPLELIGIEIVKPDDFILDLIDLNFEKAIFTISKLLIQYNNPYITPSNYSELMNKLNCKNFSIFIRNYEDLIQEQIKKLIAV